ncbi:Putative Outer membrane efflux protein, cusC-like [Candidatus Nitrotoga fabula]|uniref:Outer membrane efflux protein, cusC-like n=1 Tax=Candidatus Nitrotoga fabula TaxID=2182327 RepID=A0A916BEE0_9PROT|nr:Putative Outer membrane efflux protein, cusC-like [Candidatus Nitrotoga fabula]
MSVSAFTCPENKKNMRFHRFSFRWWWILFFLLISSLPSHAAGILTLETALRLAATHSPILADIAAQERGAHAALTTARAYPNPDLQLGAGKSLSKFQHIPDGQNNAAALSQLIELPSVREARRLGAEAGIVAAEASVSDARINLRTSVKQAFFEVLRRQEELRLAKVNLDLLMQIRDRVKLKVKVGESPRFELVKADVEVLAAQSAVKSAEFRIIQARDRLRAIIGAPLAKNFEVPQEKLLPPDLPELDELRKELLERQPVLKVANAQAQRAEARVQLERNLRIPQPTITVGTNQDPDWKLWQVGVSLPLPLWNRRQGPIGEALAGLERAEAEKRQVNISLLGVLDQAYGRYQIAKNQVKIFETGLLRDAENAMKVAEAAYRHGERGILEFLDAQRVLRTTRLDYLNARYELQAALIEIERLRAIPPSPGEIL